MNFGNNFNKFETPAVANEDGVIGHEPKLWQEKVVEIKELLDRQVDNPDIFSEYESDHLDSLAQAFPLEYAAAQSGDAVVEVDNDSESIKENLINAGKENLAHKIDEIGDLSKEDIEAFKKKNRWNIDFGE